MQRCQIHKQRTVVTHLPKSGALDVGQIVSRTGCRHHSSDMRSLSPEVRTRQSPICPQSARRVRQDVNRPSVGSSGPLAPNISNYRCDGIHPQSITHPGAAGETWNQWITSLTLVGSGELFHRRHADSYSQTS
jgi:hypothetical protein